MKVKFTAPPVPLTAISVTSSATNVDKGQALVFTAKGNNNVDVTQQAIFYVDGTQITGNTFQTTTAGNLHVYATYEDNTSATFTAPTIQVVVNDVVLFNKRVLIEDFTGTWCGYCPRVAYAIDQVKTQTNDAVVVAIHRGGNDPYNFTGATALENQIGLSGYPTAMLNRTTEWNYPETATTSINQAVGLTNGVNPKIGLAMNTSLSGTTATVEVKVKYGTSFSNLSLVVYALEDNLVYNQTNYTSYYGGGSVIPNFEQQNVLRAVLSSSILGEPITGSMVLNGEFTKTFTYEVPSNVNASNVHFVAFVVNSAKKALNSRAAVINENQSFEIE